MGRDTVIAIIAAAIVISIVGVIIISLFSYTPPQLPAGNKKVHMFLWDDVYNVEGISKARYEIISMAKGEMNKSEVLLTFNKNPDGSVIIDIAVYSGVVHSKAGSMKFNTITSSCVSKYYGDQIIPCNKQYPDMELELAKYVLPTLLRKDDVLETVTIESAVYKGNVYQAIKLRKENIEMWLIKDLPLPARMIISDDENKRSIIANLQSYE